MGCWVADATALDLQRGSPCDLWNKHIPLIVVEECLAGLHMVRVESDYSAWGPCRDIRDGVRAEVETVDVLAGSDCSNVLDRGVRGASTARASEVTTYGAGLKSCESYLDSRERQNADEVAFVEWFSGYASGVNSTSNHTNNILGDANLKEAVYRLGNYCRAHPATPVAVALDVLVIGARSARARQTAEVTAYGTGVKSWLGIFIRQRAEQCG